ncbi:ethyl tert-butyl ether degradation protein EthD [Streptomyces noursei]|uniref:ethyl tert-butyl ether degradation protein EthD n=1 Tax=Streptomyces noursei TaxID=1971 RepID=UPI0035D99C92
MTDTTIDGSIGLSDRAVHDDSALKELLTLLASDATVRIGPGSVRGCAANAAFSRAHLATFADSRHHWDTAVFEDGTLRAEWAAASRMADGQLMAVARVEHAQLDGNGLIADLRNEFARLPGQDVVAVGELTVVDPSGDYGGEREEGLGLARVTSVQAAAVG